MQGEDDDRTGKTRYWTEMEHNQFLYAVKLFGPKNYVAISQFVGTRTPKQVRTHAQKYQMKLEREAKKRRAQAAAVAAVTAPRAAVAAAAAVAAMSCESQRIAAGLRVKEKRDSDGVASSSTCPDGEMELLREDVCSPVSHDEEEEEDVDVVMDEVKRGEKGFGLKKNGSLGNLADYDDFMRRITNAVQEPQTEGGEMFGENNELDMEILHAHPKTEQFEDALLADI